MKSNPVRGCRLANIFIGFLHFLTRSLEKNYWEQSNFLKFSAWPDPSKVNNSPSTGNRQNSKKYLVIRDFRFLTVCKCFCIGSPLRLVNRSLLLFHWVEVWCFFALLLFQASLIKEKQTKFECLAHLKIGELRSDWIWNTNLHKMFESFEFLRQTYLARSSYHEVLQP